MRKLFLLIACAVIGSSLPASAIWEKIPSSSDPTGKGRVQPTEIFADQYLMFETAVYSGWPARLSSYDPSATASNEVANDRCYPAAPGTLSEEVIWQVVETGETETYTGRGFSLWYLKSVATGKYMKASAALKDGVLVQLTDDIASAQKFFFAPQSFKGCTGQGDFEKGYDNYSMSIFCDVTQDMWNAGAAKQFVINCSAGVGYTNKKPATAMDISHWTGLRAWNVYEMGEITDIQGEVNSLLNTFTANGWTPSRYQGGTAPGFYDAVLSEAFKTAWDAAEKAAVADELDEVEGKAIMQDLQDAQAAVDGTLIPLTDGYYRIVSAMPEFESAQGVKKAMFSGNSLIESRTIQWGTLNPEDASQVYQIVRDGEYYAIQNVANGYYLNTPASANAQVIDRVVNQRITAYDAAGQFRLSYTTATNGYTANGANNGHGVSGYISHTAGDASTATAWYLQPVDAETAEAMKAGSAQLRSNLALSELIALADELYTKTASVAKLGDEPYVQDASQYSSNAPETQPNCEIANLLDGNVNSYFHTAWSYVPDKNEPHYLCAHLNEGTNSFAFTYTRRQNNENNYPLNVTLWVSKDSATWTKVEDLTLPVVNEYTSKVFTLDDSYTWIKYSVTKTNSGSASNGEVAFTYAEFNFWPATVDLDRSAIAREDLKQACADFLAAINKAKAVENATEADLTALQQAIDAYKAAYPNVDRLNAMKQSARQFLISAPTAENTIGFYQATAANDLTAWLDNLDGRVEEINKMTVAEVNAEIAKLEQAYDAFRNSLYCGDPSKIYQIVATQAQSGGMLYVAKDDLGRSNSYIEIKKGDFAEDAATYWRIVASTDSTYCFQNIKTGWYLNPGNASNIIQYMDENMGHYTVRPIADGEMYLVERGKTTGYWCVELSSNATRLSSNLGGLSASKGSRNAFTFVEVDDPVVKKEYVANNLYITTLPYDITGMPTTDDMDVFGYKIVGVEKDENDAIVAVKLQNLDNNTPIVAGTPFIMEVGMSDYYGNTEDVCTLDMSLNTENLHLDNQAKDGENGLYGAMKSVVLTGSEYGTLSAAQFHAVETTAKVAAQSGYIKPFEIQQIEGASEDLTVYVDGEGFINGIREALAESRSIVNVYTVDGILVAKNVKASEATRGLKKGIYIIGKKKVEVK